MCPERGHIQVRGRFMASLASCRRGPRKQLEALEGPCALRWDGSAGAVSRTCFLVKGGPVGKCLCGQVSPSPREAQLGGGRGAGEKGSGHSDTRWREPETLTAFRKQHE